MNMHEQEERDFGRGPLLWDADPDVCCAAFQLGACIHTEGGFDEGYDGDLEPYDGDLLRVVEVVGGHVDLGDEEPF
jgi:hypothetical protein